MAKVKDLVPGCLVSIHSGMPTGVFITQGVHPSHPHLRLVAWRLGQGDVSTWRPGDVSDRGPGGHPHTEYGYPDYGWSFDALSAEQEIGDVMPATPGERWILLRRALGVPEIDPDRRMESYDQAIPERG